MCYTWVGLKWKSKLGTKIWWTVVIVIKDSNDDKMFSLSVVSSKTVITVLQLSGKHFLDGREYRNVHKSGKKKCNGGEKERKVCKEVSYSDSELNNKVYLRSILIMFYFKG